MILNLWVGLNVSSYLLIVNEIQCYFSVGNVGPILTKKVKENISLSRASFTSIVVLSGFFFSKHFESFSKSSGICQEDQDRSWGYQ